MKYCVRFFLFIFFMAGCISGVHAKEKGDLSRDTGKPFLDPNQKQEEAKVYWKRGLRFESGDGACWAKLGGRILYDWWFFDSDADVEAAVGALKDDREVRRLRWALKGELYERLAFEVEFDYADWEPKPKDVFVELKQIPFLGSVRLGHVDEPFNDLFTTSNRTVFMEKALTNAFNPSRNMGIRANNQLMSQRMTWSAGIFQETDSSGKIVDNDAYALTVRVTVLGRYKQKGRELFHFAASFSHRDKKEDTVRYRQRPEAHIPPYFVNTLK